MSKFIKRTTAPSKDNKYYYSDNIFYKCGYGMPNCTCYAWGRFYELTGKYPKLDTGNAERWYNNTKDGYARGQTPKLGSIICWEGVGSKAGHVAVVEEIYSDGSILTSNSAYNSTNFYMKKLTPPNYYMGSSYEFEGFIHVPLEFEEETTYETTKNVNVYYRVETQKHGWLGEIKNCNDNDPVNGYAGWENSPITGVAIKVDKGSVKYRVHVKGGNWLGWITEYNIKDSVKGYAGNGRPIDAIQVYYYTPNDIRPYKKAKYKVNNYGWQHDTETKNGQDGYAGLFGKNITKLQIEID